ncbi:MAG: prepilin-type N-terminal cleavage/methylation domain-containing protein [Phycisphaerales bacterium]|nr:prepilin-type N-terminal cleavage/methylation domain-containing protein [Phycisphaerales bacterium]
MHRGGFTLVELLVVISIIALLISILLPSLKGARDQAKRVKCAASMRGSVLAIATHTSEKKGEFPPSYIYPSDAGGAYDLFNQPLDKPWGYMHWSYFLFSSGKVNDSSFTCPSMRSSRGGAPRTNPGLLKENWEAGQIDDGGSESPNPREDKQAPRMAFTANAALMPRNKFTLQLVAASSSGGQRVNVLVRDDQLKRPSGTILLTEFLDEWKQVGVAAGNGTISKSHRPLHPFWNLSNSFDPYSHQKEVGGFFYGNPQDPTFGLSPLSDLKDGGAWDSPSYNQMNFVGRHHPGKGRNKIWGGDADFAYVDGHIESKTAYQTLKHREWGDRFYSIDGKNDVKLHTPLYRQTGEGPWPE